MQLLGGGVDEIHVVIQSRRNGVRESTDLLLASRHMREHGEVSIEKLVGLTDRH